jgi:hypothetical protein
MTDKQGAADLLLKECDLATDGRLGLSTLAARAMLPSSATRMKA